MRKTGERHHRAKVPDSVIREIRYQRQRHGKSYRAMAAEFGVSMWTVRDWCEWRTRA